MSRALASLRHDYLPARPFFSGWRCPILRLRGADYAFVQTTVTPLPWWYRRVGYDANVDVYTFAWLPVMPLVKLRLWPI